MAKKRIVLTFPPSLVEKPLTYRLVKDFDLAINILHARIVPRESGRLVIELSNSSEENIDAGIRYLEEQGVNVEPLSKEIRWDEKECINCGACTAVCHSDALRMNPETWKLEFDKDKCIVCEMCVPACPLRIISVTF
ncbi:MAG TPA: 4Fe-4S binding protein [Firmicutes bacterium]|nr:4Fe-4S binding protein [Bacillota bacterium]